ncbi:hypothetical protein BU17DRAFT_61952 [Hysterangium stoloniferum]|nr:hypothetical protein BU17DRAFT_61952 [Hysterangium stoloniferum]
MIIFAFLVLSAAHAFAQDFVLVDDADLRIQYSDGGWLRLTGDGSPGDGQFNGGVTLSRLKGATAILQFNGSAISVYGTIGPGGNNTLTVSSYQINDSTPAMYAEPNVLARMTKVLFYSSPALSPGEQTLKITNLGDQDFYWLDYFNITTFQSTTPTTSSVEPSLAAASGAQPSFASGSTVLPTFANASSVQPSIVTVSSAQLPTATATGVPPSPKAGITSGATAGITLGTACLFALVILGYIWLRKSRPHGRGVPSLEDTYQDPPTHRTSPAARIRNGDIVRPYQVSVGTATTESRPKTSTYGLGSSSTSERPGVETMSQAGTSHLAGRNDVNEHNGVASPPVYTAAL